MFGFHGHRIVATSCNNKPNELFNCDQTTTYIENFLSFLSRRRTWLDFVRNVIRAL